MENMVSARRLRKSMLKDVGGKVNLGNIGISDVTIKRKIKQHENESFFDEEESCEERKKVGNFKKKFFIKFFISVNIIFLCLICKLMFKEQVLNNKYAKYIINEYNKDYTKIGVLEKVEEVSKYVYEAGKFIIPEKIAITLSSKYLQYIKPNFINLSLKDEILKVFNKNSNIEENNDSFVEQSEINDKSNENIGVGGGEPYEEAKLEEVISAISIMDTDIDEILRKNINIIVPVNGTITSRYGAREQIFENVNPYHTGIDIANKKNTQIISATDGKVVKTEKMNKYYGNNVEVEKDGVIFKYAHLETIQVKENDEIKQGDKIGLMGSTGMSTGPHLHFEIKINNRTVDPEKILEF